MIRVEPFIVLVLCLSVSLAAPPPKHTQIWNANHHDSGKLPVNVPQQQPQQQQQQQQQHYQGEVQSVHNAYYVDKSEESNESVKPVGDYFTANRIERPRLVDQTDNRFDDGHYEYSYTLSNGDARYERAYWLPTGSDMILARKGYYSYPLPNNKYYTVFYTSDQNGFQQDAPTYSNGQPQLPRSVSLPEHLEPKNQVPNNMPPKPIVHNDYVPVQAPQVGVSHWNSQDNYVGQHESKRVRRHVSEPKVEQSSVDKSQSTQTTRKPAHVQSARTTEPTVVQPRPTVEQKRIEEIQVPQVQLPVPVPSHQQPQSQVFADLREHTYTVPSYGQAATIAQRQQVPTAGLYVNRQTIPTAGQADINSLHQRQTLGQTLQQPQQVLNQNQLLNYLVSRLSAESPESYSQESHELYLPGLLGGQQHHQQGGLLGSVGQVANVGGITNSLISPLRRRVRGNNSVWPTQQQLVQQAYY